MSVHKRILRWLPALLALALVLPAHAARDHEFPPNTIVVLASDSSIDADMAAKFIGKVDYICDGANDDVEIQKAIDDLTNATPPSANKSGEGGTVLLVGGKFFISSTIVINQVSALTIQGTGARDSTNADTVDFGDNHNANDNTTALIWNGAADGTMIRLENSSACALKDLLLFGKNGAQSNTAGKLIHINAPENGFGSGSHRLFNIRLSSAGSGLVFGDANNPDGFSCDNLYAERLGLAYLTNGVLLQNNQSLPHTFIDVKSRSCSNAVFCINRGGNITVLGGHDTGSTAYAYLSNANSINAQPLLFQGVRMEPAPGQNITPTLLKGGGGLMSVSFVGCSSLGGSPNYSQYAIDITGDGVDVTARDCVFSGKVVSMTNTGNQKEPIVILDACAVPTPSNGIWTNLLYFYFNEYKKLTVRNCRSYNAPHDVVDYNGLTWPDVNKEVVIWSDPVNIRTAQTFSCRVRGLGPGSSKNTMFVPNQVGMQFLTQPPDVSNPPTIQWGWTGNSTGLHTTTLSSVPTGTTMYIASASPANQLFSSTTEYVTATIPSSTSGTATYVRFFWKGYVQRTN